MEVEAAGDKFGWIEHCVSCPYRAIGPAIRSRGDAESPLVLVGEAPGLNEVRLGRPFVGRAGRLLGQALQDASIDEAGVFIINSIACRPVPVHPWRSAVAACHDRLTRELLLAPRSAIVALGATALSSLTGRRDVRVLQERGRVFESELGPVVSTIHPARVLRRPDERANLVADLALAHRIASVHPTGRTT
jgi:uracil-DNA glycosylase family 4